MTTFEKITNVAGAWIFGALGSVCLVGAAFFGATHQIAIAAICGAMTLALRAEAGRKKRKHTPVN